MEEQLKKRKLYDVTAPNRSTGIINGESSNVLNWDDIRFPWAYNMYRNMMRNFWVPEEINMGPDKKQFLQLSDYERETFKKVIGLLAFLDSIQTDYSHKVSDYLTDSSLSALMAILSFQEVVHNQSYSYVLSSVATKQEQDEVFEFWKTDPVLRERNDFIAEAYERFTTNPTPQTFLESIVYDVVLEGLNFYSGFAFFYNLARNQKMVRTSTMINYINRDEQLHVNLFCHIFRELMNERPELNTAENREKATKIFKRAAELEINWAKYIIGNKFDGLSENDLVAYIQFIANKRCRELGVDKAFPDGPKKNPLPWIKAYEEVDLGKTDFFEQKSRQYKKAVDFDDL